MRPFFETVVEAIRTSAAARVSSVRQARSRTRAMLAEHRSARRAIASSTRRALLERRVSVLEALQSGRAPAGPASAPASAVPPPDAAPRQTEQVGVWDFWSGAGPEPARPTVLDPLQRQVLRVIENNPEGVRAIDVGNELGVDWRRVVGAAHGLLDAGAIEQIDQEFYPAGKAGGRW